MCNKIKISVVVGGALFLGVFLNLNASLVAAACTANFEWIANIDGTQGYRIYYGQTQGGPYPIKGYEEGNPVPVGGMITASVLGLAESSDPYYFVCRAYEDVNGETGNSAEAEFTCAFEGILQAPSLDGIVIRHVLPVQ